MDIKEKSCLWEVKPGLTTVASYFCRDFSLSDVPSPSPSSHLLPSNTYDSRWRESYSRWRESSQNTQQHGELTPSTELAFLRRWRSLWDCVRASCVRASGVGASDRGRTGVRREQGSVSCLQNTGRKCVDTSFLSVFTLRENTLPVFSTFRVEVQKVDIPPDIVRGSRGSLVG